MNSNSIFTRRHAGADAAASVSAPATTSAAAEDAFKNDPTATLEGVRGKDVTKAAKALLKDSVKRGGGSIQMRDVVKIYPGSTVHALDDFNLDIKPGEMVVLLGGSGCGKSTALRSLAGLEDIQGGRIMVGGQDVTGVPVNKREMAMVFQAYSLFPHMTALENVEFGLEVRGMGKAERRKIAMEQLELVGLADQAKKYTQQMSGGQQQRVALARALAVKPRVLLLDEPLVEASRSLGASWPKVFFKVIIPNLWQSILSASFISIAVVLGEYTVASLLGRMNLQVALYQLGQSNSQISTAMSLLALLFGAVLLVALDLISDAMRKSREGK